MKQIPVKWTQRFIFDGFKHRVSTSSVLEAEKKNVQTDITPIYYASVRIYTFCGSYNNCNG